MSAAHKEAPVLFEPPGLPHSTCKGAAGAMTITPLHQYLCLDLTRYPRGLRIAGQPLVGFEVKVLLNV